MMEGCRDISAMISFILFFSATGILVFTAYTIFMIFNAAGCSHGMKSYVKQDMATGGEGYPFVSVIVTIRNEEKRIPVLLQSLASQVYPRDRFEVLISDDYSEDSGLELVANYFHDYPGFPVRMITPEPGRDSGRGKKAALTRAILVATGEIILCTDGDTRPGPGWIASMVSPFSDERIMMALGSVFYTMSENLLQRLQEAEYLGVMGVTAGSASRGFPITANGGNMAFRRQCFHDTGGFDKHIRYGSGDDQFLMMAIRKDYGRDAICFVFDRKGVVETIAASGVREFLDQRVRWLSKSRAYREGYVIMAGIITFLPILWTIAAGVAGALCLSTGWMAMMAGMILWKTTVDFIPARMMHRFRGHDGGLWFVFPAALFQMTYVPIAFAAAFFRPVRWKGRRVL